MDRRKTYRGMAGDLWPQAMWIAGEGPWAVVASCWNGTTVTLWDELKDAVKARGFIDQFGCGGRCYKNHFVARLSMGHAHEVKFRVISPGRDKLHYTR